VVPRWDSNPSRLPDDRRLCRLQRRSGARWHRASGLLGACPAQIRRRPESAAQGQNWSRRHGAEPHQKALRHRARPKRRPRRRTPGRPPTAQPAATGKTQSLVGQDQTAGRRTSRTENAIRPFVIGRKNWLFSDTPQGATASAQIYSLIETAKANGQEPYAWLCHVLERLPGATCVEDYEALLLRNSTPNAAILDACGSTLWGKQGWGLWSAYVSHTEKARHGPGARWIAKAFAARRAAVAVQDAMSVDDAPWKTKRTEGKELLIVALTGNSDDPCLPFHRQAIRRMSVDKVKGNLICQSENMGQCIPSRLPNAKQIKHQL